MKIVCECGAMIVDQSDQLPHKAQFIADQDWDGILEAIDEAIEKSGNGAKAKEAACMKVRELIGRKSRSAWQCSTCGRLYLDDQTYLVRQFVPASDHISRELFRTR